MEDCGGMGRFFKILSKYLRACMPMDSQNGCGFSYTVQSLLRDIVKKTGYFMTLCKKVGR